MGETLPRSRIREVLRYWRAMVQHEERLGRTLKVAPKQGPRGPVDLRNPVGGQYYFKLPLGVGEPVPSDALRAALRGRPTTVRLSAEGERRAFFEHWLEREQRSEWARRRGQGGEEERVLLLGFPVVHFPRKGELATALRFPLAGFAWLDAAGQPWKAPDLKARKAGKLPAPPAELALTAAEPAEGELPFSVDELLWTRHLGVVEEHLGKLTAQLGEAAEEEDGLSPAAMLARLVVLLESEGDEYPAEALAAVDEEALEPAAWLERLTRGVAGRLAGERAKVWPGALVYDPEEVWATFYLKRDLGAITSEERYDPESPFVAYMTGAVGEGAQEGRFFGRSGDAALTDDQRRVAERFLGSRLTAAQGPPGTGKTRLILEIFAHALVERMAGAEGGDEPELASDLHTTLVTSTNNRAVDNVIDPLCRDLGPERLPLALRLGSKPVVGEATRATLLRVAAWLKAGDPERAGASYGDARERLAALLEERDGIVDELEAPRRRQAAEAELEALEAELAKARAEMEANRLAGEALKAARRRSREQRRLARAIDWFEGELRRVVERLERDDPADAKLARRLWPQLASTRTMLLEKAATGAGLQLTLPPTVPADADDGEAWLDMLEETDDQLRELRSAIEPYEETMAAFGRARRRAEELDARVATARAELVELPAAVPMTDERERALYERLDELGAEACGVAIPMREAWALLNRVRLLPAVERAAKAAATERSLLSLFDRDPATRWALLEIFPALGCTLLSLGNAFPPKAGILDRVIIDEAGQCHPAYAVSALYRARRALVIGDTNQLEPIYTLDELEEDRVLRRIGSKLDPAVRAPFRPLRESGVSAQSLADRCMARRLALRDHFRCQAPIIRISDRLCHYGLRVRTPRRSLAGRSAVLRAPVMLVSTRGRQLASAGSWKNERELEVVRRLVLRLLRDGVEPGRIAVLTPYRGQLFALRRVLRDAGVRLEDAPRAEADDAQLSFFAEPEPAAVAVGTVHRFQGGERDVVIFSAVVSRPESLPFLNGRVNLVNVAVSRARMHLLVVGDPEVLRRGPITAALVESVPPEAVWVVDR